MTVDGFLLEYKTTQESYDKINAKISDSLKKKIRSSKRDYHIRLSKKEQELKNEYLRIVEKKEPLDVIYNFKEAMNKMYLETQSIRVNDEKLDRETIHLAIAFVKEIDRLKEKYKSFFVPLVHNMLIDVGIKKRGACKDWAEDLLSFARPIERDFFYVTWGEAYPGGMKEHNVLVLYPMGSEFKEGLVIDPWRTSGKPFWIRVKDDKHYPWKPWKYYGVY